MKKLTNSSAVSMCQHFRWTQRARAFREFAKGIDKAARRSWFADAWRRFVRFHRDRARERKIIPGPGEVSPKYLDSAFDVAPAFTPPPADPSLRSEGAVKVGATLSNELRDTTLPGWQSCANPRKSLVPKRGLEPPRPYGHYTLNVARLPIPPLRHACYQENCSGRQLRL